MGARRVIVSDVSLRQGINQLYLYKYINQTTFFIVDKYLADQRYHHFFHVLANQGYRFKGILNSFIKNPDDNFNISVSSNRVIQEQPKSNCKSIW